MKCTNSFILSLVGVAALLALGLAKNVDVSIPLVSVVAAYVGSRAAQKSSGVWAASRDTQADTVEALKITEGVSPGMNK
jgi:hypothetical protein